MNDNSEEITNKNKIILSTDKNKYTNLSQNEKVSLSKNNDQKSNKITLIFRNQLSEDILIEVKLSKIKTISELIDLLFIKTKKKKNENTIRLFFKGRPLKQNEEIKNISNKILIIIFYRFNSK